MMTRAVSRADLVIIPLQPSGLDARQAARAVELIQVEEETLGAWWNFVLSGNQDWRCHTDQIGTKDHC